MAAFLNQIADVGENEIDPRQIIAGEGNAEVDRKPTPVLFRAEAVKREIHADLADTAERREDEFIGGAKHGRIPVN